ncbi:MAG: arylsulfatase [Bacteroidetes bacterium]|nr:arylsulfatase [Bacteroidota bacterium]
MKYKWLIPSLVLLLAACWCQGQSTAKPRPNIVLILADDLGYSDIGCYGGELQTPNLDKLAAGGVRFLNFYNNGRCCPSRASLLTGLFPHEAGIGDMVYANDGPGYRGYLDSNTVTLAETLGQAGYQTLMSGKWHVGHAEGQWPTDRGFQKFYGINKHVDSYYKVLPGCEVYLNGSQLIPSTARPVNTLNPEKEWYTTDAFTDYALSFLKQARHTDNPFFLYLAYNSPHFPLEAPDSVIKKYVGKYKMGWDRLREEKFKRMKEMGLVPAGSALSPSENPRWDSLSADDQNEMDFRRAIYAAQVDVMDRNIGRVLNYLDSTRQMDNTVIIFLSDNGCSAEEGNFGLNFDKYRIKNYEDWKHEGGWSVSQGQCWANVSNVPFRLYKKFVHQGGIATPFIVHWPGHIDHPGSFSTQVGHIIDLMPTLVDIAGGRYPRTFNGRTISPEEGISLRAALEHPGVLVAGQRDLAWEHIGNKAYREGNMKLVLEPATKQWALYDLSSDPYEMHDLSGKFPEKKATLLKKYEQWAARTGVRPYPIKKS